MKFVNGFISLTQLLINVMLKILQVSPDGNNWALILGSEDQGVRLGEAKGNAWENGWGVKLQGCFFAVCVGVNTDLYCSWQGSRRLEQVFSSVCVCVFLTAIRRGLATVSRADARYSLSAELVP